MGTVDGLTKARMLTIEAACIVDGVVVGDDLHLTQHDGTVINAGSVRGDPGPSGSAVLVIADTASRPTGGDAFSGLVVYQEDTGRIYSYDGAAWHYQCGGQRCTFATRPTIDLFNGFTIYETDTKRSYIYHVSDWLLLPLPGLPHTEVTNVATTPAIGTNSSSFGGFATACHIVDFVKLYDDTKLIIEYNGSLWNDNELGGYEVAIEIDGEDYVVVNGYGSGGSKSGSEVVEGLAAGTYSCLARRRRTNGAGFVWDGQVGTSRNCLSITETF